MSTPAPHTHPLSPAGEPGDGPDLEAWLRERAITEVECLVPDLAGIPRGKILPTNKFLSVYRSGKLRLPESVFAQTVTGEVIDSEVVTVMEPDIQLIADPTSIRIVPWYEEPTAQVICDAVYKNGSPVQLAPRHILRKVIALYHAKGWKPVVAPELEFFLAKPNPDSDYPLEPPIGRSGRQESGSQSYGIDAVNEFDPLFDDMYDYCEAQGLDVDTLIHESGVAQVEINFDHGDPLSLADQAFLFKRTVRQAALKHKIYVTFMAKPYEQEPGSAFHIHQSIHDLASGKNLFADETGADSRLFLHHIAGLQRYLPQAMLLIAPYVNSYRRVMKYWSAPINTSWGHENRTVGLRIPDSEPDARRVENRVPGADANPYLAIAASLICGYLGMVKELEPTEATEGNAYEYRENALPRHLLDALYKLRQEKSLHEHLGDAFIRLFIEIKTAEHDAYQEVISPWEREHLLLNV